eukprot:TRINITY_DN5926_c0_g1_i1.p1 TRINITY_DN5926_c0_g1~~TRINITY_DN5926_c0_g1_i1.p1  ORF type:complete len:2517 (-),score=746.62 TRINITY_DN5926_c0_g1_i1:47-7120(-)
MTITLRNGATRAVIIDESKKVNSITKVIAERLNLSNGEEFALRWPPQEGDHIHNPRWLAKDMTLHAQDVDLDTMEQEGVYLIYSKRFFFSDEYIDKDHPVELNMLFIEMRAMIMDEMIKGVTRGDIVDMGAMYMQILYGDHDVNRHKAKYIDKSDFFPISYKKHWKKLEAEVLQKHKNLVGTSEIQAKYRYVQLVRAQKWYGTAFFLVKQIPTTRHGKIQRMWIGVTKDAVIRVDHDSDRTLNTWNLTHIARWDCVDDELNIDLGDYDDQKYKFQTDEAAAISDLIAGYIDIILERRRDNTRVEKREVQEDTQIEEIMLPQTFTGTLGTTFSYIDSFNASSAHAVPVAKNVGQGMNPGMNPHQMNAHGGGMKQFSVTNTPKSQRVQVKDIGSAYTATKLLSMELGEQAGLWGKPGKLTQEEWIKQLEGTKMNIANEVNEIIAISPATWGSMGSKDISDRAKKLQLGVFGLATAARNINTLNPEENGLLDGARAISSSIADLMQVMNIATADPTSIDIESIMLHASAAVSASNLLAVPGSSAFYIDEGTENLLVECIDEAAYYMNEMVATSAMILEASPAGQMHDTLEHELKKVEGAKEFNISTLRNLAPAILDDIIMEEVNITASRITDMVGNLVNVYQGSGGDQDSINNLNDYADHISNALKNLLESASVAEARGIKGDLDFATPANKLTSGLAQLRATIAESDAMIGSVKVTAAAHNDVIRVAKGLAGGADDVTKERLLNGAMKLSEGIRNLILEARTLTKNINDPQLQDSVLTVVGKIEGNTQELITDAGATVALANLRHFTKKTAAAVMRLSTSAKVLHDDINDAGTKTALMQKADLVSISDLISALNEACKDTHDYVKQYQLMESASLSIPSYENLCAIADQAVDFIGEDEKKEYLRNIVDETISCVKLLTKAVKDVGDIDGQTAIEQALEDMEIIEADLQTAGFFAHQGLLRAVPGITQAELLKMLGESCDGLLNSANVLSDSSKEGMKLQEFIHHLTSEMLNVSEASRGAAASYPDRKTQKKILQQAKGVWQTAVDLIATSRALSIDKTNAEKILAVDDSLMKMQEAIGILLDRSDDQGEKELNQAIALINANLQNLANISKTNVGYKEASEALQSSGKALSSAVSQLVSISVNNPTLVGQAAKMTSTTTKQLLNAATLAISSAPDSQTSDSLLNAANSLADALKGLLGSSLNVTKDSSHDNIEGLKLDSIHVGEFINELITSLGNATSPEAEEAINLIMELIMLLESGDANVFPMSREELLIEFQAVAKDMSKSTQSIVSSSAVSTTKTGMYSKQTVPIIRALIMATLSAREASQAGKTIFTIPGTKIMKGSEYIISNPENSGNVVAVAKQIIELASDLLVIAKRHARGEVDKQKRNNLVGDAQSLVSAASQLALQARQAHRRGDGSTNIVSVATRLQKCTKRLESTLRTTGPQDESEVSQVLIDPQLSRQLVITSRTFAMNTTGLIRSASAVASNPDNETAHQELGVAVNQVQDSISSLLSVCSVLNPGIIQVEKSMNAMQNSSAELQAASISTTVGGLTGDGNVQESQENCAAVCKALNDDIRDVVIAAINGNPTDLINASATFEVRVPELASLAKIAAGNLGDQNAQKNLLDLTKDLTDNLVNLLGSVKDLNVGSINNATLHSVANTASESIGSILSELQSTTALLEELDAINEAFAECLHNLSVAVPSEKSYREYRDELTRDSKSLAGHISALISADKNNLGQLGIEASQIGHLLPQVIDISKAAIATTREQAAKVEIASNAKDLVKLHITMIDSLKGLVVGEDTSRELRGYANEISAKIGGLLNSAKKGAIGEILIEKALEEISESVQLLDTSSIFAQAGQLDVDPGVQKLSISILESELSSAANKLAKGASDLNNAARGSDEDLGAAATGLAHSVGCVSESTINAVSRITDAESQQNALSAAKFLAIASQQLLLAGKEFQRIPGDRGAQETLAQSYKSIGDNISNLVGIIQANAVAAARGERELEGSKQQILALLDNIPGKKNSAPEDIIFASKDVSNAIAAILFASTQEDMIESGRKSFLGIRRLLNSVVSVAEPFKEENLKNNVIDAAKETALIMCDLIDAGKLNRKDPDTIKQLESASRAVTASIHNTIEALNELPGIFGLGLDEDFVDVVEQLTQFSKEITNSANTLNKSVGHSDDESSKVAIDRAILDSAHAISNATIKLVDMAASHQGERQGKPGYKYDATWAKGIVKAGEDVTSSVKNLVRDSNSSTQGSFNEDAIVSSARAVASATAQLVSVSGGQEEEGSKLQGAAKAVANATSALVTAAHRAAEIAEQENSGSGFGEFEFDGGQAAELEQQMRILKLERQLERERRRMGKMRG